MGSMSSVFQGIFGGSKSKQQSTSESYNQAYPYIKDTFGGIAQGSQKATSALESLLGLSGDPNAYRGAFDNYRKSAGYDFLMDEGTRAITGNAASRGLLQSGSTLKGLNKFGQGLASTFYNSYLDRLSGLTGQGLQAGALISGAGQRSQSQSTGSSSNKPGLGGFIGGILSGGAAG